MMNDVMPSIVQMDAEELQKLVAEVKETVASVIQLPTAREKSFGHLDMWKIRKTFRTSSDFVNRR